MWPYISYFANNNKSAIVRGLTTDKHKFNSNAMLAITVHDTENKYYLKALHCQ